MDDPNIINYLNLFCQYINILGYFNHQWLLILFTMQTFIGLIMMDSKNRSIRSSANLIPNDKLFIYNFAIKL